MEEKVAVRVSKSEHQQTQDCHQSGEKKYEGNCSVGYQTLIVGAALLPLFLIQVVDPLVLLAPAMVKSIIWFLWKTWFHP